MLFYCLSCYFWTCIIKRRKTSFKNVRFYRLIDQFQLSVAFHIETNHLLYWAKQMTGFYIKFRTPLKWINPGKANKDRHYIENNWLTNFSIMVTMTFNLFHVTGVFLYSLKTWEILWFSDIFRRYRKRLVSWNESCACMIIWNTLRF